MRSVLTALVWVAAGGFAITCLASACYLAGAVLRARAAKRRHEAPVLYVLPGGLAESARHAWRPPPVVRVRDERGDAA